ncbi:hypothetical protein Tco_0575706 [Tanacetum coccineum]
MIRMLQNINKEDLETLWKLVKAKHGNTRPEEAYERVLWGDLKVMFEPDVETEYSVSTSTGYGVSNFLSNIAYSFKLINTAYLLPLDTAYRSSGTEADSNNDINIELTKEFLEELQMKAYHGWIDEDVINYIDIVLKMIDWIYIPGEGKITVWEELVERFFYKFYPESYDGEEEMLDEGDNWGIDPLKFISRVNSSFDKHMKMDGRTKKVIFHAWINRDWNKRRIDKSILRSNNTTIGSFFKPYLVTHRKSNTKKEGKQSQTKRNYSNTSNSIDEQPNKIRCKAEKFEAIQYSLRPNEEYIAIRSYEYDI